MLREDRIMDLVHGMIIGIVYVATPGPISVETLRQGIKGGFTDALAIQIGSSVGLVAYALLALLGAGLLIQEQWWLLFSSASGAAVLLYMGITTILDGRKLFRHSDFRTLERSSAQRAFSRGATLSLTNPLDLVFWLTVGSRVLLEPGGGNWAFWGGLLAGCILTALGMAFFAGFWHSRLSPKAVLAVSLTCGLALISFGLSLGFSIGQNLIVWLDS
jgi:threonine/homoserine/homoserine lactone efflux protein